MGKCLNFLSLNCLIWKMGLLYSSQAPLSNLLLMQVFPASSLFCECWLVHTAHQMLLAMLMHLSPHLGTVECYLFC